MKPSTQKILEEAKAFVEQKKAEGWTKEDFANALGEILNANTKTVWEGNLSFRVEVPNETNEEEVSKIIQESPVDVGDIDNMPAFVAQIQNVASWFKGKVHWYCDGC